MPMKVEKIAVVIRAIQGGLLAGLMTVLASCSTDPGSAGPRLSVPFTSDISINEIMVAQIDHVCQLLGSADHVGIGSDFDGGFGQKDIPAELDSIADLSKIGDKLKEKGYDPADIDKIFGGNWVNKLRESWS